MLTDSSAFEITVRSSFIMTKEVSPKEAATARNCRHLHEYCEKGEKSTYNKPWQDHIEFKTNYEEINSQDPFALIPTETNVSIF